MKNFDNFDESIKQKMDGMNFQFNDANWEKMSEMIDASRPTKKPFGKLPLISFIVVGSALIISSVWYMMSDASSTKEVAENTQAVEVGANSNVTDANVISANNPIDLNNNSTTSTETKAEVVNDNSNSSTSNNKNVQLVSDNSNSSSNSNAHINTVSTKNENKILATKTSHKKNVASRIKKTNDNTIVADLSASTDQENVATNNFQTPVGEKEGDHLKTSGNSEVTMTKSGNNESTTTTTSEEKNINADDEETDVVTLPTLTTNVGQTADQIAAANLKTATVEEKKAWEYVRVKHHTVSLEGGAINSFGWRVNQTRNGNNLSPVLGINYMYNFDSRSSLLIGLQYNSVANLGEAKANFSVTSYGFGVNNDVTTYKLMDLHYAVMPVKYIHRINKNNALGFGMNMMYLMNTRTEITKTTMVESNVSTSGDKRFEMGYGFDQLNTFNTQIAVSYHHSISNKLALNAELNKALFNVVKDYKYFGAKNASSAPAAIKLSLTYTLFNK